MNFAEAEEQAVAAGQMVEVYERWAQPADDRWNPHDPRVAISFDSRDPDAAEMRVTAERLPGATWDKWAGAWVLAMTRDAAEFIDFYQLRCPAKLRRHVRSLLHNRDAYDVMLGDDCAVLRVTATGFEALPGYRLEEGWHQVDLSEEFLDWAHAAGLGVHPDVEAEIVLARQPGRLSELLSVASNAHSADELPAEFVTMVTDALRA